MEKYMVKQAGRIVRGIMANVGDIAEVEAALPEGQTLQLVSSDQQYGLFIEGRVSEVVDLPFEVHVGMTWVPCPSGTIPGLFTLQDGVLVVAPLPPPPRRKVAKLTLSRRIIAAGLADTVAAALDGNAIYRLLWEGITEYVYADDEEARTFLLAITGSTEAVNELLA